MDNASVDELAGLGLPANAVLGGRTIAEISVENHRALPLRQWTGSTRICKYLRWVELAKECAVSICKETIMAGTERLALLVHSPGICPR